MPEYKKKKVRKIRKDTKNTYTDEIKMIPKEKRKFNNKVDRDNEEIKSAVPAKKKIHVIRGNKLRNKKRKLIFLYIIIALVTLLVTFSFCLPTGVIEFLQNSIAKSGTGNGYQSSISGGSLINAVQVEDIFITVTPTQVSGYNCKSGKSLFNYSHGYERPLITTSEARFIIYSQGEKEYGVYNFQNQLISAKTQNDILTAKIARNGTFAIATQSDGYSSEVAVYNKKGKEIYRWFCADYIINDIQLDDTGRKLVLSAINAQKGSYVSKLYVLEFDSATPVYTKTFENQILLNLDADNAKSFYAIFENRVEFFNWNSFENKVFETNKTFIYNRPSNKCSLLVAGQQNNKGNNTVYVFDKKGDKISEFNVDYEVQDIAFKGDFIYILSDKIVYLYSVDGEKVAEGHCTFGTVRVLSISHHNAIVLTDNSADKIDLK